MRHNSTGISEQVKRNIEAITEAIIMKMLQKRKLQPVNEVEEKIKDKFDLDSKSAKQYVNTTLDKLKNQKRLEYFPQGQYPMIVPKREMIIHPEHENKNEMQHKDFFKLEEPVFAPANLYPVPLDSERIVFTVADSEIVAKQSVENVEFDNRYLLTSDIVEMNVYETERGTFFVGHQVIDSHADDTKFVIEQLSQEVENPELAFGVLDTFNTVLDHRIEKEIEEILDVEFTVLEDEVELN
ncbi:hypothetical protein ShirakiTB12_54010 [Priestia megaterium]|uniref:Uncharacterized protein n=1 Tax=Priestia megaterium TaxID=1404 RepID=A0AAX6BT38_PRIMG|nr:hypothetical protein [Priestia megaterium]GMG76932.1 hypothetical protein ShirakiTB12_54010 [Priestia megaterium]